MILTKADRLPPFVCRLLARTGAGWEPLTTNEIAAASGLPRSTVEKISKLKSWATVPCAVADKFAEVCGVNLAAPSVTIQKVRRSKMAHLLRGDAKQRKLFAELMALGR